ncbi:Retrovirus-related Pol polyprotein from transposon TNT 1-94 [Linum perenne]
MQSDSSDSLAIKFNGKNYDLWSFQFRFFVKGKALLSYLDGTAVKPELSSSAATNKDKGTTTSTIADQELWETNNAKVFSWLIGSMEPGIALTLRTFESAADVWAHLRKTYSQVNVSRVFEVEYALASLTQGDMDIRSFHLAAQTLWTEQDILSNSLLTSIASAEIQQERHRNRVLQFLMKLRPEFESARSHLISSNIVDMDTVLGDLVRAETRYKTQAQIDGAIVNGGTVFATSKSYNHSRPSYSSPQQQSRPQFGGANTGALRCRHCGENGHMQSTCRRRNFCNYCKRPGHINTDCRGKRAAYSIGYSGYGSSAPTAASVSSTGSSSTSADIHNLVQEAIQQALPTALNAAFATFGVTGNSQLWHLDSACFNHMTGHSSGFQNYRPLHNASVQVANGQKLPISGIGDIQTSVGSLRNTLHVPSLVPNLVSVGQLTDDGYVVSFSSSGCYVQDQRTRRPIKLGSKVERSFFLESFPSRGREAMASKKNKLLFLNNQSYLDDSINNSATLDSDSHCFSTQLSSVNKWNLWHSRLGHPHSARLKFMIQHHVLPVRLNLRDIDDSTHYCTHCIEAKSSKQSFSSSETVIAHAFDLIHTDLWGPSPVPSRLGYKYFVLFVDLATRFTWIYWLRAKSELFTITKDFIQMVKTQFDKTIKVFRSDPCGEYSSNALKELYKIHDIHYQMSCPGVSEQNGLVERKNRHVLELARAMLLQSHVPPTFWPEVVKTAVYLINRQVTPILQNQSPYFSLYGRIPSYTMLRVFGCVCFVLLPRSERNKLTAKTAQCVFMGYSDNHKGYVCYDPHLRRMRISYHVVFLENQFYYPVKASPPSTSSYPMTLLDLEFLKYKEDTQLSPTSNEAQFDVSDVAVPSTSSPLSPSSSTRDSDKISSPNGLISTLAGRSSSPLSRPVTLIPIQDRSTPDVPRRPQRSTRGQLPSKYDDFVTFQVNDSSPSSIHTPANYKEAILSPEWRRAMDEELTALDDNHTWSIVPRPPRCPVIGSKWVYTIKYQPDGTVDRYKARLVAQGFRQEYGIDYDETFAPVAKMSTVRTLLAVASQRSWPLMQLDVKNAFLHGDLKETVYMECPPGFKERGDMVCHLHRSLYGLKQAPRAWFEKFQSTILQSGFAQSSADPSLFTRHSGDKLAILLIYVDDMILSGDDQDGIEMVKKLLETSFQLKDLGNLSYFLGLEIKRSEKGIFISQRKYIEDLLLTARHSDCTPCSTPMDVNVKLGKEMGDLEPDPALYRRLVGSLIYLTTSTRSDLAYAVQAVSQFMSQPRKPHLVAVYRILRYLQGTRSVGIFLPAKGNPSITAFADADYAGCVDTRRSTSGWIVKVGNACVSWRCKKQDRVAKSSTEAEYRSMSEVCSEIVWLIRLLTDLGVDVPLPATLYGDNTSAIQIASNPVLHDRTKHIETHVHFIRDLIRDGDIQVQYLNTENQIADLLTKAVCTSRHWYLAGKLMCRDLHQFEGGC